MTPIQAISSIRFPSNNSQMFSPGKQKNNAEAKARGSLTGLQDGEDLALCGCFSAVVSAYTSLYECSARELCLYSAHIFLFEYEKDCLVCLSA